MKLFSISSRDTSMDAMFYIRASTKQQASYIFSTLSPKPTANCQLTDLQNETVVPSISPISLSLNPWSINSQSRTRELRMATHGLNLICAVTDEHTRQIVDFCDNLGQQQDRTTKAHGLSSLILNALCLILRVSIPFCLSRIHRHNLKSLCQLRKMENTTRS